MEQNKNRHVDTENRVVVTKVLGLAGRESKMGKGDQPYDDRWKLNFRW